MMKSNIRDLLQDIKIISTQEIRDIRFKWKKKKKQHKEEQSLGKGTKNVFLC